MDDLTLCRHAIDATRKTREVAATRRGWEYMGYVGAALLTNGDRLFTGVNLNLYCGIGFCAEHSAVAEMLKAGETRIATVVAATAQGTVIPPCGRCRELLYQVDERNLATRVIVAEGAVRPLGELLPLNWQTQFDQAL